MKDLSKKIIDGYQINKEEAIQLLEFPLELLTEGAQNIRKALCGDSFDMCTIINAKSGHCSEDCKYCAQSRHYNTKADVFPLLSNEKIVKDALENEKNGVNRYSLVTSGKRASKEEVDKLCNAFKAIQKVSEIKLCASNGLLDYDSFLKLKQSGVTRYHNNLETSRKFFPSICSTHSYDEKINTIKAAQKAGLNVCSGGIIGLGESNEDRIDMAFELRDLNINSIPLNLLNPIEGTPLFNVAKVSEEEFIRIAAIFRYINPKAIIRLAGGRSLLTNFGKRLFKSGVNGTISGNLLTTYGNSTANDIEMIKELNFKI